MKRRYCFSVLLLWPVILLVIAAIWLFGFFESEDSEADTNFWEKTVCDQSVNCWDSLTIGQSNQAEILSFYERENAKSIASKVISEENRLTARIPDHNYSIAFVLKQDLLTEIYLTADPHLDFTLGEIIGELGYPEYAEFSYHYGGDVGFPTGIYVIYYPEKGYSFEFWVNSQFNEDANVLVCPSMTDYPVATIIREPGQVRQPSYREYQPQRVEEFESRCYLINE